MKKRIFNLLVITATVMMIGACGNNVNQVETSEPHNETEVNNETEAINKDQEALAEGIDYLHGTNGKEYNPVKALDIFEEAARENSAEANFLAGYVISEIMYGNLDNHTMDEAITYLEKCAEESPYARALLGIIYSSGGRDINKAKELCESAAQEIDFENINNSDDISIAEEEMMAALLILYYRGTDVQYDKAFELVMDAEKNGAIDAAAQLGDMYIEGFGTEIDYKKGREFSEKAYEKSNNRLACHNLGFIYEMGLGVEQDINKALSLYEESGTKGQSSSYRNLAMMYEDGRGVESDFNKAVEYYEKAVELGDDVAMRYYGMACHYNGDYEKAKSLYEQAIENGNIEAYADLAILYLDGTGVEKDATKAFEYTQKGAKSGEAVALVNLGLMYYVGSGVEADLEKAIELFVEAARKGNESAKAYCEQLGINWEQENTSVN